MNLLYMINSIVWAIGLSMMFINGIYFSCKLKLIQFRFIKQLKSLLPSKKSKINSFETLSMSLASRIGVGSISGIALAIYLGGAGVVFWMWISGIITSANSYVESVFGKIYQEKIDNNYVGGPSYYIKKALSNNKLAIIYSIIIIISYVFGFLPIQSNTIVRAVGQVSDVNYIIVIFLVCFFSFIVIYKDTKKIAKFCSIIVPIMAIIYILMGLYIVINNINKMPIILFSIIKEAFNFKAGLFGFFAVLVLGVQRGLFASEAGIGTSAIATGSSDEDACKQGLSQVFGIYFTVFIICNITAFIILLSSYNNLEIINPNGIEVTLNAFKDCFGQFGSISLCIVTVLFAFSTIVSCYYYTESSLKYIFSRINNKVIKLYKIFVVFILFLGAVISSNIIWKVVDLLIGVLAIINIYAIRKIFDK